MEHKFKPFDQVLVRDLDEADLYPAVYRYYDSSSDYPHICDNFRWKQCIPYNEETAHLVGTNEPYKEPEPKVWNVKNLNTGVHHEFTQNQFEHFMDDVLGSKECCAYSIHRIN